MRLSKQLVLMGLAVAFAGRVQAGTYSITDNTFSNWNYQTTLATNGGTASAQVISGSPNYVKASDGNPSGASAGAFVDKNTSTDDVIAGASYSFSIDMKLDPATANNGSGFGTGTGQQIRLTVEQNGVFYDKFMQRPDPGTADYHTYTFTGTLSASDFSNVANGSLHPNFSGGVTTYFGFGWYNGGAPNFYIRDYTNYSLTLTSDQINPSPVPEPSTLVSSTIAALGGLGAYFRRRLMARNKAAE